MRIKREKARYAIRLAGLLLAFALIVTPYSSNAGGAAYTSKPTLTLVTNCDTAPVSGQFDEGIGKITGNPWGGKVGYGHIGGWTVSRGYFDGQFCITGFPPQSTDRVVLMYGNEWDFILAGDSIIYYGEATKGDYCWLRMIPGEKLPSKLPLDDSDVVFYADDQFIWYYTTIGYSNAIVRATHDGSGKKKLGMTKGIVMAMMPGEEVLLLDHINNCVQLWKNGKYETIYRPENKIWNVISTGRGIWIDQDDGFGPLMDGEVRFRLPGHIVQPIGSTDQIAFLVEPFDDTEFFDVYLSNEVYHAYAYLGKIKRSDSMEIELGQDHITVWGIVESIIFDYPMKEQWLLF